MKGKMIGALVAMSLGFVTQNVFADNYIQCDGCSPAQESAAAIAHGIGSYVVGDVLSNKAYGYTVYRAAAPEISNGGQNNPVVYKLYSEVEALSTQDAAAFTSLVNFYNAAPVGYQKQYNIQIVTSDSSVTGSKIYNQQTLDSNESAVAHPLNQPAPGSATATYPATGENVYTFINSGSQQNGFLHWVGGLTVLGINSTFANVTNSSILTTLGGTPPQVYITVTFTDGSHIGVYVDMSQSPPALSVNEASGVDSHGNNVPATAAAVTGSGKQFYIFLAPGNPTDQPNMAQQLGSFGFTVSPTSTEYACTRTPDGASCAIVQP